jgi:hypothetical protein
MKPLVYLVNELGLAPFWLQAGRGLGKFRPSTLLSVYSVMMTVILLLGELLIILREVSHINVVNVYKFAVTMKSSEYMISQSGLILVTLLFRSEIIKFLHVLLSFNSSIHNIFVTRGRNFSYMKAQVSVLLTLCGLSAFVIILVFKVKGFLRLFYFFLCGFVSFINKFNNRLVHKLSRATDTMLCEHKHMFM